MFMDQYLEDLITQMNECVGQEMQVGSARLKLLKFKVDTNYDPPLLKMEFKLRELPSQQLTVESPSSMSILLSTENLTARRPGCICVGSYQPINCPVHQGRPQ